VKARARQQHMPGQMNRGEAEYDAHLKARLEAKDIVWYDFEPFKLKLADLSFYTPDFVVQVCDATFECHEVKPTYRQKLTNGTRREAPFCFEDAKLKIRFAANKFKHLFKFVIVFPLKQGGWGTVEF